MRRFFLTVILISSLIYAANSQIKYPYSFKDFNPALRPYLEKIVNAGGDCYYVSGSNYLIDSTSVDELKKMTLSEHPLLRAAAFHALCYKGNNPKSDSILSTYPETAHTDSLINVESRRNSNLIDSILLNHLDDTATITFCRGEFGRAYIYVSDYYLYTSRHKTKILETVLQDEIMSNHNYLATAYNYDFISFVKMKNENSYPIIKKMATSHHAWSRDEEYRIISALSEYKKKEDVQFIFKKLEWLNWGPDESGAFAIIENNPDTSYFKLIERFYRGHKHAIEKKNYLQYYRDPYQLVYREKFFSFLGATAAYKNQKSLDILNEILQKKIYPKEFISDEELKWQLYTVLSRNKDAQYYGLLRALKSSALAYEKKYFMPAYNNSTNFCAGCEYW